MIYIYICISKVGGSETNREIDFGFGSCVRARALVVRWEFGQILTRPLSLFPFPPAVPFPFPFSPSGFAGKPTLLCVINTKQNTRSAEFLVEKEHSPLENDPGHGNAQIGVFRHQGTFWAEYFVCLLYMGLIIFQTPYPEQIINNIGAHECPWGAHGGP